MKERLNPIFDTIPSSEKISLESRFCNRFLHNPGIRQNEARSSRRVDRAGHRRILSSTREIQSFRWPGGNSSRFIHCRESGNVAPQNVTSLSTICGYVILQRQKLAEFFKQILNSIF